MTNPSHHAQIREARTALLPELIASVQAESACYARVGALIEAGVRADGRPRSRHANWREINRARTRESTV